MSDSTDTAASSSTTSTTPSPTDTTTTTTTTTTTNNNTNNNTTPTPTDSSSSSSSSSSSTPSIIRTKNWLPLESNPSLMNKYIHNLGINKEWGFIDIYGIDNDLLLMVPQPCKALLLLFPITDNYTTYYNTIEQQLNNNILPSESNYSDIYFIKQKIGNACGTIGLIHALLNNINTIPREKGSFFDKFYKETITMNSEQRAVALNNNTDIEIIHESIATEAKSEIDNNINDNLHFICLIQSEKTGELIELDGMKSAPISHGITNNNNFLFDAAKVVKKFMERDPNDVRFNMVGLVPLIEDAFD